MINEQKLNALAGNVLNELGAAANAALVLIGHKHGLYRALSQHGPLDAASLAKQTATHERYVREWLSSQAASGFIQYDASTGTFSMTPEQAAVLVDENSLAFMGGGFHSLAAVFANEPRLARAFKTGEGIGWEQHCGCLFCGSASFYRPGYNAHLVREWLPALDGVVEKLQRGARVADVGCGHGFSTAIMAEAFPNSEFIGFDFHAESIEEARSHAGDSGNLRFEVARAQDFPGAGYELVTVFDALHDMGNPVAAISHIRRALTANGTLMVVEPMAGDRLEDNLNPVGRVFYAFSTHLCVPASLNQEGRLALGAQAGERRLRNVVSDGGFTRFRLATATPFNMVIEARP